MTVLFDANTGKPAGGAKLDENVGQKPENLVDKILEQRKLELAMGALQSPVGGGTGETLAATVVNKALDVNLETNKQLQEQVRNKEIDLQTARNKTDEAKNELYKIISDQVSVALLKLEKVQEDIHSGKADRKDTKSVVEQVKEARELLQTITPTETRGNPSVLSASEIQLNIQLQQMKQDHEQNMRKLDIELEKMRNDLQFKLAEMTDNRTWKEREWEEGKDFKKGALSQIGDIAAGIAAGFQQGRAPAGAIAGQTQPGEEITALIKSFPCQKCGTDIAVPLNATEVNCPNPGCGVKYYINKARQEGQNGREEESRREQDSTTKGNASEGKFWP